MRAALLAAHVLAAIVLVGPVTVTASVFPRYVRAAAASGPSATAALASASAMHRVSRTYAVAALAVPVLGVATAGALGVLTQGWVLVAMALTAVAGLVLALAVVPQQRRVLLDVAGPAGAADVPRRLARLAAVTGVFNLVWAVVVVLMILRPGSTTGV
ncbi:hypothetical protein [Microlunatus flavus]|uniref:Uncharacterized protein n=1 Tax=Microlunatus flavus TaxID=1036181 RepID=A0A1H9HN16_9ACTN|nr:hypothetical protein [Microlunatus flavus]SEQ63731.1 hypothetical protein SAMN05421756_104328 [Microlunatus flavus]